MNKRKKIPIGIEDFKTLIDRNCYYVDKTLMIRDILDSGAMVNLFTRPRRFGKSLNMSMLRYFFEAGEDHSKLFENLAIMSEGEEYLSHMGRYPVISLTLKGIECEDFDASYNALKLLTSSEFNRHIKLLDDEKLLPHIRNQINSILDNSADYSLICNSLKLLSDCLFEVTGEKVIVLIDEYDVPLQNAYFHGFYEKMVGLLRLIFSNVLKTNTSLNFAVLSGCLRVSKESIFTGLNNLNVNSIRSGSFSTCFGFTANEVRELTEYYGLIDHLDAIKDWYDGYRFGADEMYNPWSVLMYLNECRTIPETEPESYWSNTSSNSIIQELIENSNEETKEAVETLINGGIIEKPLYEDITYANIGINENYIWSFLLYTGYLKPIGYYKDGNQTYFKGIIPNREVAAIYETKFRLWFQSVISRQKGKLLQYALNGDTDTMQLEINQFLLSSISYYDNLESFYHGMLAGLLRGEARYELKSNRENGTGRSDIIIKDLLSKKIAVVIEVKIAEHSNELDARCDKALKQIEDEQYAYDLQQEGYQRILKYGIAFYKKTCLIKCVEM